jgi:hypothetical protein
MNLRIGFTLLALCALPAFAGDSASSAKDAFPRSAKDALHPSPKDAFAPSAKDAFAPSAKDAFAPSAKDAFAPPAKDAFAPSAKSAKSAKDILLPPPPQSRWVLGAGLSLRNIGEIDFDTGVTNLTIPMLYQAGNIPVPGIGPAAGFVNRHYDNGFVRPDARTPGTNRTNDFGYNSGAQVQGGSTLTLNAAGGERTDVMRTTSSAATSWSEDREWELAPYLKLSRLTELGNGWSAGPAFHFTFANIDGGRGGLNTILGREQRDTYDVSATDTYNAAPVILPAGAYVGAPNVPGAPLLPAEPTSRVLTDTLRSTDVAVWNDSISESLDVDLWGLSIGAEAAYQANNKFYATVGAGFSLNVADWEGKRSDRVFQQINNGPPIGISATSARNSGSAVLWGLYLQSAAVYQVTGEFSVEANLRYDLTEDFSGQVGNSHFTVDLSGFSVGVGGSYTFW